MCNLSSDDAIDTMFFFSCFSLSLATGFFKIIRYNNSKHQRLSKYASNSSGFIFFSRALFSYVVHFFNEFFFKGEFINGMPIYFFTELLFILSKWDLFFVFFKEVSFHYFFSSNRRPIHLAELIKSFFKGFIS